MEIVFLNIGKNDYGMSVGVSFGFFGFAVFLDKSLRDPTAYRACVRVPFSSRSCTHTYYERRFGVLSWFPLKVQAL